MATRKTHLAKSTPRLGARLTRKRYALRLPLELASRLEALCEMFPLKTRAQLVSDLLGLGLAQFEQALPAADPGQAAFQSDIRQPIYLLTGPFSEFHGLTRKHHLAMERELAREDPEAAQSADVYGLDDAQ